MGNIELVCQGFFALELNDGIAIWSNDDPDVLDQWIHVHRIYPIPACLMFPV
jgi:hypothetical protein